MYGNYSIMSEMFQFLVFALPCMVSPERVSVAQSYISEDTMNTLEFLKAKDDSTLPVISMAKRAYADTNT